MIAIIFVLLCFLLFYFIANNIAAFIGVPVWAIWLLYYVISDFFESRRLTHLPWLRKSAAAKWLGSVFMRSRFSPESAIALGQLTYDQYIFVGAPHGVIVSFLVFGFALHGGSLPKNIADRTFVVAHRSFLAIPILRNLYAMCGVIDNRRTTVETALQQGLSLAAAASAVVGKWHSMMEPSFNCASSDVNNTVREPRRPTIGIFVLAARYGITVVPLLSPNEDDVYRKYNRSMCIPPLVVTLGWWFVRPHFDIEWRVGREIVTKHTRTDGAAVARLFYKELQVLGGHTHHVVVYDCHCTAFALMIGRTAYCGRH